jgi:hypothetical protein
MKGSHKSTASEGKASIRQAINGVFIAWNEFEFVVVSRVLLVLKNVKCDIIGRVGRYDWVRLEQEVVDEARQGHQNVRISGGKLTYMQTH